MLSLRQLGSSLATHRRRIARGVLVLGLAVAVVGVYPSFPHDTEIELLLGEQRHGAVELRVAYMQDGEELQGVSFGFPGGAPERVRHTAHLPRGRFEVRMELRNKDGQARSWTRELSTPAEGIVRFRLGTGGPATAHGGDA